MPDSGSVWQSPASDAEVGGEARCDPVWTAPARGYFRGKVLFNARQQRNKAANGQSAAMTTVAVTRFDDVLAMTKRERVLTLENLAAAIRRRNAPHKGALPLLKLARFGDTPKDDKGCLRHDKNVIAVTGCEADYDGERIGFETAVETLKQAGINAIVYTSPSHSDDKPRWRVLCPFAEELRPERRDDMMDRLNGVFGGIFAGESWTLSQGYFYGAVNGNAAHRVELVAGRPIDLCAELDAMARPKANGAAEATTKPSLGDRPDDPPENLSGWVRELITEGTSEGKAVQQRGKQAFVVVQQLHRAGYTQAKVIELVAGHSNGVFGKYAGRLAAEIGRMWSKLDDGDKEPPPEPLQPVDPRSFRGQPIPEREWVVPGWVPCGVATGLYGPGGTGKSLLAMQLMTAAALGRPWLGVPIAPVRSIGFSCEDDENELLRRQAAINGRTCTGAVLTISATCAGCHASATTTY